MKKEIKVVYGISEEYFDLLLAKTSEVTETISKMRMTLMVMKFIYAADGMKKQSRLKM